MCQEEDVTLNAGKKQFTRLVYVMNKKTFLNLSSKERSKYKASVAKLRKINGSVREVSGDAFVMGLEMNGDTSSISRVASLPPGGHTEIIKKLDTMETRQIEILKFLNSVDSRLTAIEKNLKNNMPSKTEVQEQSKMLRECQALVTKTQQSICRITGDMEDEEYLELSSELPMSSVEHVRFIEEKLLKKESAEAMMRLMVNAKGSKGSVDGVLRGLFSDDAMYHYNLEGRKNKKPFLELKSVGFIFDIFPDKDKNSLCEELRRFVILSHNRLKQRKHKLRAELE